jgi:hypothetical protein
MVNNPMSAEARDSTVNALRNNIVAYWHHAPETPTA